MSYDNSPRAPLQWTDLHTFTEEGTDVAVRVQHAQGDNGPQYSLAIGRMYKERFTGFFRMLNEPLALEAVGRLYAAAQAYANDHKRAQGPTNRPRHAQGGGRDRDWDSNDGGGRGGKRRARA